MSSPERWFDDLEARHFSDLTFSEVRRGIQALTTRYVEKRRGPAVERITDGAGKRAAFAYFYGILHYFTVREAVLALGLTGPSIQRIVDLGGGTGVGGAAWAIACDRKPEVQSLDRDTWAVREAAWNFSRLGIRGAARRADARSFASEGDSTAVLAAYFLNELPEAESLRLVDRALQGGHLLIVEPIAKRITPAWSALARRVLAAGGREDEWRFTVTLPERIRLLDKAAGLDHRQLTCRTLAWQKRTAPDVTGQ